MECMNKTLLTFTSIEQQVPYEEAYVMYKCIYVTLWKI